MISEAAAEGFVLAGGESSRMGRDKAMALLGGRPLIEIALSKLRSLSLDRPPRIAGVSRGLAEATVGPALVVADAQPGRGPLGGIEAALAAAAARRCVFLAVDLPLVPSRLLAWMLERAALTDALATFPRINGRAEPLCAIFDRGALPHIRQALAAGKYSVVGLFAPESKPDAPRRPGAPREGPLSAPASLSREEVDAFDLEMLASVEPAIHDFSPGPLARWFLNANTPADLDRIAAAVV